MTGRRKTKIAAALAAGVALLLGAVTARAATIQQRFAFRGSSITDGGAVPLNGNLLYAGGQLYGATYAGGIVVGPGQSEQAPTDLGAIFQYPADPSSPADPVPLYGFSGPDGAHPNGGLVADAAGNLYGTTQAGGADGLGTVFKLSPPTAAGGLWTLTTLHSFAGGTDGANPAAGVTLGPDGYLYGTTMSGGQPDGGCCDTGIVFKLDTAGTTYRIMTSLYPGIGSRSNVVVDAQLNVLGTTYQTDEPRGAGSLFKVTADGTYTTVVAFQFVESPSATSTANPIGNLVRDSNGNIYGMLSRVDMPGSGGQTISGAGIFKLASITHAFTILGVLPNQTAQSGVVRDGNGNLYGTTVNGGATGTGSIFELSASGAYTLLASLGVANQAPVAGVVFGAGGTLWGTSSTGGVACTTASNVTPTGCGTLFALTP